MLLTELIESVRKDVECLFGIMKQRFRILRIPFEYHDPADITDVVRTCAILHNMMLLYDGLDLRLWEENIDWESIDPDGEDDVDADLQETVAPHIVLADAREEYQVNDIAICEVPNRSQLLLTCTKQSLDMLNEYLRNHYMFCRKNNKLAWPKRK